MWAWHIDAATPLTELFRTNLRPQKNELRTGLLPANILLTALRALRMMSVMSCCTTTIRHVAMARNTAIMRLGVRLKTLTLILPASPQCQRRGAR